MAGEGRGPLAEVVVRGVHDHVEADPDDEVVEGDPARARAGPVGPVDEIGLGFDQRVVAVRDAAEKIDARPVGLGDHQDRVAVGVLPLQGDGHPGDAGFAEAGPVPVAVDVDVDIARERAGGQFAEGVVLAERVLANDDAGDAIVGQQPAQRADRVEPVGVTGRLGFAQGVGPRLQAREAEVAVIGRIGQEHRVAEGRCACQPDEHAIDSRLGQVRLVDAVVVAVDKNRPDDAEAALAKVVVPRVIAPGQIDKADLVVTHHAALAAHIVDAVGVRHRLDLGQGVAARPQPGEDVVERVLGVGHPDRLAEVVGPVEEDIDPVDRLVQSLVRGAVIGVVVFVVIDQAAELGRAELGEQVVDAQRVGGVDDPGDDVVGDGRRPGRQGRQGRDPGQPAQAPGRLDAVVVAGGLGLDQAIGPGPQPAKRKVAARAHGLGRQRAVGQAAIQAHRGVVGAIFARIHRPVSVVIGEDVSAQDRAELEVAQLEERAVLERDPDDGAPGGGRPGGAHVGAKVVIAGREVDVGDGVDARPQVLETIVPAQIGERSLGDQRPAGRDARQLDGLAHQALAHPGRCAAIPHKGDPPADAVVEQLAKVVVAGNRAGSQDEIDEAIVAADLAARSNAQLLLAITVTGRLPLGHCIGPRAQPAELVVAKRCLRQNHVLAQGVRPSEPDHGGRVELASFPGVADAIAVLVEVDIPGNAVARLAEQVSRDDRARGENDPRDDVVGRRQPSASPDRLPAIQIPGRLKLADGIRAGHQPAPVVETLIAAIQRLRLGGKGRRVEGHVGVVDVDAGELQSDPAKPELGRVAQRREIGLKGAIVVVVAVDPADDARLLAKAGALCLADGERDPAHLVVGRDRLGRGVGAVQAVDVDIALDLGQGVDARAQQRKAVLAAHVGRVGRPDGLAQIVAPGQDDLDPAPDRRLGARRDLLIERTFKGHLPFKVAVVVEVEEDVAAQGVGRVFREVVARPESGAGKRDIDIVQPERPWHPALRSGVVRPVKIVGRLDFADAI